MKLVILDGCALNPGDLDYSPFSKFGEVTIYDRTPAAETAKRISDAELVITNKTVLDRAVLEQCPNVQYIGLLSTGYNIIDLEYTKRRGIVVCNVPSYSTHAVAQQVFGFILYFYNQIAQHSAQVAQGKWEACKDFCFYHDSLHELLGKTIGIIGFGSIGKQVALIAQAFGMRVLVHTRTVDKSLETPTLRFVSLDTLLEQSDVVSLHCPLFAQTTHLINADALSRMKPSALLINTSRGGVVDEVALAEALNAGRIAGAGIDVVSREPILSENPLLGAKNCVITPHIAWAARETRTRLLSIVLENLEAYLAGTPINTVG